MVAAGSGEVGRGPRTTVCVDWGLGTLRERRLRGVERRRDPRLLGDRCRGALGVSVGRGGVGPGSRARAQVRSCSLQRCASEFKIQKSNYTHCRSRSLEISENPWGARRAISRGSL